MLAQARTRSCEEAHHIERSFWFRNSGGAWLVQKRSVNCRAEGHHPNISFGCRGNATVSVPTKKIHGLHQNNFIVATKINHISLARPHINAFDHFQVNRNKHHANNSSSKPNDLVSCHKSDCGAALADLPS